VIEEVKRGSFEEGFLEREAKAPQLVREL